MESAAHAYKIESKSGRDTGDDEASACAYGVHLW